MNRRWAAIGVGVLICLAVPLTVAFGRNRSEGLRLCGAADLTPLTLQLEAARPPVPIVWSSEGQEDRLGALRRGKCDAVLIGYEPEPGEIGDLRQTAIARDAVVFLIDENTYQGGEVRLGGPVARSDPLRELSLQDLKGMLSYQSVSSAERWHWQGRYSRWETCVDRHGRTRKGRDGLVKCWRRQPAVVQIRQTYEPGRFDTQTALYRLLRLDEQSLAQHWPEFSHGNLTREEQVIAREYQDPTLFAAGQGDFQFRISFASLRVAKLALRHVPVRVVAIEGIDPVADPSAVLDGRYPLTRPIYVVHRADGDPRAEALADWLASPEGQKLVADAGFLPMLGAVTLASESKR